MAEKNPVPEEVEKLKDDLTWLRHTYNQYLKLFVGNEIRIKLINETAPHFFNDIQRLLWHHMILGVSRLTDEHKQGKNRNLSINILLYLANENEWSFYKELKEKVDKAIKSSETLRNWRMKYVAHRDYDVAMNDTKILGDLKLEYVDKALTDIGRAINLVYGELNDSSWSWNLIGLQNVDELIHHLKLATIYKASFSDSFEDYKEQNQDMINAEFRGA